MQGEANAHGDGRTYNCSFPAMIEDWRAKWAEGTGGTTDVAFPFGWSQLNSNGGAQKWVANSVTPLNKNAKNDPLDKWSHGFRSIRLAEENTLSLSNTFQAVIIDTPVASGSVHSPYKQAAGSRLARGALATTYNTPQPNPVVKSVVKAGANLVLTVDGLGEGADAGIEIRSNFGFEILGGDDNWHTVEITGSTTDTVTFGPAPAGASGVRYLWGTSDAPCGNAAPYKCAVNIKVPALGALSGEFESLPLGPFIQEL